MSRADRPRAWRVARCGVYRDVPAVDQSAVALVLVKLAQLAANFPQIREVDLNPLLADETGLVAVDARISLTGAGPISASRSGHPRLAIRPYPKQWERHVRLGDGTAILMPPVRPEDEPLYGPFFAGVTQEDLRLRFFAPVRTFDHVFIARFTQIDYSRAMAFIAIEDSSGAMLGVVPLHADANYAPRSSRRSAGAVTSVTDSVSIRNQFSIAAQWLTAGPLR